MRAAVSSAFGGPEVIEIREVPKPVPGDHEILIAIRASTVSAGDWRIRSATFPPGFGLIGRLVIGVGGPRRKVLGADLAGVVTGIGAKVTRFKVGEEVFAMTGPGMGGHAEFKAMREGGAIARKPAGFSFEEAASIAFGGSTALHYLSKLGKVRPGDLVLINGAAGAVGSAAVQIAKHLGAEVTGIASAGKADLVRRLGADEVVDYATTDFAGTGRRWDVILDTVGNIDFERAKGSLEPGGRLLLAVAGLGQLIKAPGQSRRSGFAVKGGPAPEKAEQLDELRRLCEAGAFKPLIDSVYPLERIADAHRRVDSGRKAGNVVVMMSG